MRRRASLVPRVPAMTAPPAGLSARRATVVAGLAGLATAASLPPSRWWPLGIIGVGLLVPLTRFDARRRFLLGWIAGAVHFGIALAWMADFSLPGVVAAVALESLFPAAALTIAGRRGPPAVTLPAALVLAEAARQRWPLGGLPLGGLALGQAVGPLAPVARLAGELGIIAVAAMAGTGAVTFLGRGGATGRRTAVAALSTAAAIVVLGAVTPPGSPRGPLTIAAVQGGGPRGTRAVDSDPAEVFARHLSASDQVTGPVDVVLWPEDVVDVAGPVAATAESRRLSDLARRLGATVVAGVVEGGGKRFRNAAVAWAPDGAIVDRYDKVHRVPFGEYVPARRLVARLADLSAVPRDALPGRGPGRLETPAGRLGVLISYEVFFSGRARAAARTGASVLVVPTNTASYRGWQVPAQELAAARLRALETGLDLVQAAPTGYSAAVDASGHVRGRSALGHATVLTGAVDRRSGETPYTRTGDAPTVAAAVVALAVIRWRTDTVTATRSRSLGRGPHRTS